MHKPRSQTPRYALALLLLAALATLAFMLPWSRASRPDPSEAAEALPVDPQAQRLLDEALADLGPDQTPWLETKVRQQVHVAGVAYTAEGRYQTAPGQRCRLELSTQSGQATGTLLVVSDGQHLWRGQRVGNGAWASVERAALKPCFKAGEVGQWPQARADNAMSFSGVAPLLHNLRSKLEWVGMTQDADGHAILTGVWSAERRAQIAPRGQAWPTGLPRTCRLTMEVASHWPQRVEWWGPTTGDGRNSLLAEMDFGDPVRNQSLTAEQCGAIFAFDPGATPVKNQPGEPATTE